MSASIPSFIPVSPPVFDEYASRSDHDLSKLPATKQGCLLIVDLLNATRLRGKALRIFDAGCNRGHVVDAFNSRKKKVARYIGMDFVPAILDHARAEAPKRFGLISYEFRHGDILNPESFNGIQRDNNLVLCTAVAGHLTPEQIKIAINNLSSVMKIDNDSRMIVEFTCYNYILPPDKEEIEDGIRVNKYNLEGYNFRAFNPEDMITLFNSFKDLKVDRTASYGLYDPDILDMINPKRTVFVCLKRK